MKHSVNHYIKFLFKDSLFYGSLTVLTRFLSIFTMPIFTRMFTKGDYGSLDVLSVVGNLLCTMTAVGLDGALVRFFCDCDSEEAKSETVSVVMLTGALLATVVAAVLYLFADTVTNGMLPGRQYVHSFRLMVASLPFSLMVLLCLNVLKITFDRKPFFIVSLGSSVVVAGLAILLVTRFGFGVNGIFSAQLVGNIIFSVLGLFFCRKFLHWPKSLLNVLPCLKYGFPVMLTLLATAALPFVDRFFVTRHFGLEAMAMYAVGYKIAQLLKMPVTAFQMAWGPLSLSTYRNDNAGEMYNKVLAYYVLLLSFFTYGLAVYAQPLSRLLASAKYAGAEVFVLPLVYGLFFESVGGMAGIGIDLSKKTYLNLVSYGAGIIVGGATIICLINPLGVSGVAYGIAVSQLVRALLLIYLGHRSYPLKFDLKAPALFAAGTFLLAQVVTSVLKPSLQFGLGTVALLMIPVVGYGVLIPSDDRKYLGERFWPLFRRAN